MMDVKNLPFEERAQCVAYMRATHNMSQTEIGQILGGLSQPHVSRLLKHAEKENYIVIEQRFAKEKFTDDWIRQIDALLAPSGLVADLGAFCQREGFSVPNIRVFESGPGRTEAALSQRRSRFGRTASGRLIELIEKSDIVGVAWGRTIKAIIEGVAESRQPLNRSRQTVFAAVCAEFLSLAQHGYSASRLTDSLDELFNEVSGESMLLTGFPAYVPRHYNKDMQASIWRYISDTPGYNRIFSGPDALVHKMDMLISSVGSSNMPVSGSFEDLIRAGGLKANDLRRLVIGDLGGILIPKSGLSKSKTALIDELNGLWTGIKTEQVRAIADRAFADRNLSGVVVVAIQAERGDTVFELICSGLVNEIVIDQTAAARLHERIRERLGQ